MKGEPMSIILKGIDLPNSGQIEIIIRPHGKVFSKTRGISAEAIQIPKGHGRIVELKDIRYCAFSSDGKSRELEFLLATQVEALPTILEAEEE